ncbi:MAG: xanthine dehydrogenase, partial [Chloroflexi bacterium]
MNITLKVNNKTHQITAPPNETLLTTLRSLGYHSVRFGDEHGYSGSDTILLDGKPVNAGMMLTAQAEGHKILTVESLGEHPEQGWKKTAGLHPIQEAFIETGAIQGGYYTPAQILTAKALLD